MAIISNMTIPDSAIVRDAQELVRSVSSEMLYNHVMRSYYFAELIAKQEGAKPDSELLFLSAAMHDLGFTNLAGGTNRFEIEGAHAARRFLLNNGQTEDYSWKVWNNIALHVWDINYFRDDTSRIMQLGIASDVGGVPSIKFEPADVSEILHFFPRLNFKKGFYELLQTELNDKQPYPHRFHLCTCIDYFQSGVLNVPSAEGRLNNAPFDE